MKKLYSFLIICSTSIFTAQTLETNKANLQANGCITYEADANQNRIPDFSHAGYKGGGVAIPEIPVVQTISPIAGDNTVHIQAAIDAAGALPLDTNGFRGAVLLNPGTYEVSGQLFLNASGVVLRGAGDGRDTVAPTIIQGTGNVPNQRDVITLGGGSTGAWNEEVSGTQQNITSDFVQVGSRVFDVADASPYSIGDNIIVFHPATQLWLDAIDGGGTATDPNWSVGQYNIIYNRFITNINGNEITIDAPVYNHLDKSLSQSYIFKYDRSDLITNVGVEDLRIDIIPSDVNDPFDEIHAWSAIAFHEAEDGWVKNVTATGFGYAGVKTRKATHVTVTNVHAIEPVSLIDGGRRYNFVSGNFSNNILFEDCYANNGRHTYAVNGTPTASGIVFLRNTSENPFARSEPHRQWSNGILYDNFVDFATRPGTQGVLGLYNRGSGGSSHGWSAVNSVVWNTDLRRPGPDGELILEKPPIGQNYAIGVKGEVLNNNFSSGYVEHNNADGQLIPESLYEAQLVCRTGGVISNFEASHTVAAVNENISFTEKSTGSVLSYSWDFGADAVPPTATGAGPHQVSYSATGTKTVTLTVSNVVNAQTEVKTNYISVEADNLFAVNDVESLDENTSIATTITSNDNLPPVIQNKALSFDGVDDAVHQEDLDLIEDYPFSMMAWVKIPNGLSQNRTFLFIGSTSSNVSRNSLEIDGGDVTLVARVRFSSSNTVTETIVHPGTLNDGNWHHVAAVFESPTNRKLYVDGANVGTDTNTLDIVNNVRLNSFSAGNRQDRTPDHYFQGEIDDVRLYNDSFDATAISSIMQGYDCEDRDELLHWDFNEQPNSVAKDNFNYFDGTVEGTTTVNNTLEIANLNAIILSGPSNGTAIFTNDFEITYTPSPGFAGTDQLTYQLIKGECEVSEATITYNVQSTDCLIESYAGNFNTGFEGVIGGSSLELSDDGTTITGTFTKGAGDFNNDMVIYIDSKPGGFSSTANFNDLNDSDPLRRAIAGYGNYAGSNRSVVNFPSGFQADYAISMNTAFGGLWELIENASFPFVDAVGNPASNTTTSFTFSFDWSELGITNSEDFSFVITYLNAVDSAGVFRSNEGYGDGLPSSNPGANDVIYTTARNYPYYYSFDGTSWSPQSPDGVNELCRSAILNSGNFVFSSPTSLKAVIVNPQSVLDLNADLSSNIRFKSDANGSGQIADATGASINGNIEIERYILAKRAFRLLASPVTSSDFIYENWQESGSTPSVPDGLGTHITGGTVTDGFDQNQTGNPSMFTFDNTNSDGDADQSNDWLSVPNTNATKLIAGKPYLTMVRGDRSIDVTSNTASPTITTLRAKGDLFTGTLSYTVGNPTSYLNLNDIDNFYNLIANPYQAVVDFNEVNTTGLTDFIYVWDAGINGTNGRGGYVTVELLSGNVTEGNPPAPSSSDANQFLPPGMSFFVQNDNISATSTSIIFEEQDKATGENQVTIFSNYDNFYINSRLYKTSNLQSGESESDALGLRFGDGFTTTGDSEDATKLFNPGENYAIQNNGLRSVDKQQTPAIGHEIDLSILNYQATNYSLTFIMENKPADLGVFLEDKYINSITELTNSFVYDYSVDTSIPESVAEDRFSLVFDNTTLGVDDNVFGEGVKIYPNPTKQGHFTIFTPGLNGEVEVELTNALGQQIYKKTLIVESNEVTVNALRLNSGIYIVKLTQDEQSFTSKLIVE